MGLAIQNIHDDDLVLCLVIVIGGVVPVVCHPCVLKTPERSTSLVLVVFVHLLPPITVGQGVTRQCTFHHVKEVVPVCVMAQVSNNILLRVSHYATVVEH